MKALLINPLQPKNQFVKGRFPVGLAYIGAVVRKKHKVTLLDLNLLRLSEDKTFDRLRDLLYSVDVVLTGGLSSDYKSIKNLCRMIKRIKPSIEIIIGNTVATYSPKLVLDNIECDYVVMGEGEVTIMELLDHLEKEKDVCDVYGIGYKKDDSVNINLSRERIKNLDSLPFPAWDLFDIEKYLTSNQGLAGDRRNMNIFAVRGCPYDCKFCSRVFGSEVIARSAKNVLEEIKILYHKYGVRFISFGDNLFTINQKYAEEFCDLMEKEKLDVNWNCDVKVNLITDKLIQTLRRGGCIVVNVGFESGCDRILKAMNKAQTMEQIENAIEILRRNKMNFICNFIIGYPEEDRDSIEETTKFRIKHNLAGGYGFATPFAGSELYDYAIKKRYIENEDKYLESMSGNNLVYNPLINFTDIPTDELVELKEQSMIRINRRFKTITYRIYKYFSSTGIHGLIQFLKFDNKKKVIALKRLFNIGVWWQEKNESGV